MPKNPAPPASLSTLDAALSAVCTASALTAIARRSPASDADLLASLADVEAATLPLADALRELATAPRPSTAQGARADRRLQRSARGYRARQLARIAADDAAEQINEALYGTES
jgi:hypothetical protein